MPLKPGAISRADLFLVAQPDVQKTVFEGDYADDPREVTTAREQLRTQFPAKVVAALKDEGYQAAGLAGNAAPPPNAVVINTVMNKFDAGSKAARALVGFGSGKSFLELDVQFNKAGAPITNFSIEASSGGRGGWGAMGSWLENHIDDSVEILSEFVQDNVK
jgi:hypothetical protein